LHPVYNREYAQKPERPERTNRNAAQYIVPMNKGVEKPTMVFVPDHRHDPAKNKFHYKYRHKPKINDDEIYVNIIIVDSMKIRQIFQEQFLNTLITEDGVEDYKSQICN